MDRKPALLAWHAGVNFGWGVAGLNIFRHWALSPDIAPLMAHPIRDVHLSDEAPETIQQLCLAVLNSNKFAAQIAGSPPPIRLRMPVVHALGNHFARVEPISGVRNIGRVVLEDTNLDKSWVLAGAFDALVCASRWNAEVIGAACQTPVRLIHETVDHALFHPAPKTGLFAPDRFHIFTGGKIEFRKGQDLVVMAFREFSRRHDDAVLVTAWHSPWPQVSVGVRGRLEAPVRLAEDGRIDVPRWAAENGVDASKVVDLGALPNHAMPMILREADCALQPSRAEGGTNFVAMEAMACGLPVIVAGNTGMLDLIGEDSCIALTRQGPVQAPDGSGTEGWGESDVDEILEALERLYASRELRRKIGAGASRFMHARSWARHAAQLKDVVFDGL